jgi:hypothetical protein
MLSLLQESEVEPVENAGSRFFGWGRGHFGAGKRLALAASRSVA